MSIPRVPAAPIRVCLTLLCAAGLPARTAAAQHAAPVEPGSALTVYLMTMGPGAQVWERFGHNAIWVHDRAHGTDRTYNYGMFSFRQENFLLRFIQGRMYYWMQPIDAGWTIETYREHRRSIWAQELNLAPAERQQLQDFLEWNAREENKFYRYDYYRDNCSTRVRDAIDRVLGGQIRRQTDTIPTGATYRFHTARLTAADLPIYTGLLVALGKDADRPISAWEEMFIPMELRDHLRGLTITGADGRSLPLVREERTIYLSDAFPVRQVPPSWLPGYLLAGIGLAGLIVLSAGPGGGRKGWRAGFGLLAGGWTLVAGVVGVILAGLWGLTDHAIAYRNENLFQFNLFALGLCFLLPAMLRGRAWAVRPARGLALAVAALSGLGLVLQLMPALHQANGSIIALALPVHLAVAWGVYRVSGGEKAAPPREVYSSNTFASTNTLNRS